MTARTVGTVVCAVALAGMVSGCSVLRNVNASVGSQNDIYEEPVRPPSGPDALIDTLGEPDETTQSDDDGKLRMTAIWRCVEGNYREVTWESRQMDTHAEWVVIEDITRGCDE